MNRRTATAAILASVFLSGPAFGAEPPKWSARIRVNIAGDKDLQPLATSYISRELRGLPGVTVTDERFDYEIKAIIQQDVTASGMVLGFSMGYVFVRSLSDRWMKTALDASGLPKGKGREALTSSVHGAGFLLAFKLVGGPVDSVQQTCQELVAELDGGEMDKDRREYQRRVDAAPKKK